MKSNDEVMILIKIREQKEEIARLKDKVEGLQDRIDSAINYMERDMIDREVMCYKISQMDVKELLDILKGE